MSLRFNAFLKILLSVVNIIIPIIVGPYIIRVLNKESYDTFTKATVELQLFISLATLGVYTYGIRTASKIREEKSEIRKVYTELFLLGVIMNALFSLFYLVYIRYINNHSGEIIYLILMLQFVGSALNVEWMNEATENYRFIMLKSVLVKAGYVAAVFIFVRGDNLIAYGLAVSAAYVLENILSFIYITRKNKITLRSLSLRRHLKPLLLVFLITNISLLYAQTDKLILGLLISDHAVSVYNIPHYIATSVYNVVISIIVVSVARLCSLLNNKDRRGYLLLHNELVRSFYMIFIPLMVFIFVGAGDIIALYAAGKYNESVVPLKIFTFAIFLNSVVYIERECALYLHEREKAIIACNLTGGLFNLTANVALYFTGYFRPAAAVATLAASFFIVAVMMRVFVRKVDRKIDAVTFKTATYFLFSLPLFLLDHVIALFVSHPLIRLLSLGLVGALAYLLLLLTSNDRIFINNLRVSLDKIAELKNKT